MTAFYAHASIHSFVPPSPFMAKLYKKFTRKEQRKLKKRAEKDGKMVIKYGGRDGTKKLSGTKGLDLHILTDHPFWKHYDQFAMYEPHCSVNISKAWWPSTSRFTSLSSEVWPPNQKPPPWLGRILP